METRGLSASRVTWKNPVWMLVLSAALSGCGYMLQGGGTVLPPDVRRIYVPLVENNTSQAGMTTVMTEALRDRFERFGVVTIVDDLRDADAVLRARIVKVSQSSRTSTSRTDNVMQYDTTVTVAADLQRVTGQPLWETPGISVSGATAAAKGAVVTTSAAFANTGLNDKDLQELGSREVSRGSQQQIFEYMAEEIAKKIYNEAVAPDF